MGISAGLGSLLAAGIGAASSAHTQAANAAAQSKLNKKTMDFNHKEAELARKWEANEAAINRLFNQRQSNTAMTFSANQAKLDRSFQSSEALKGRNFEAQQSNIARQFDAQQSLLARQFEERMSSSAHQREVSDLRAAGLNPILSATGGSGASTPVAPVIGAPLPSAPVAHGSSVSGSALPGTPAKGVAAAIGGLNAYMKKDVFKEFVNSAIDGFRLDNDIKRAKAEDLHAKAHWKDAETHEYSAKEEVKLKSRGLDIEETKVGAEIDKLEADIELAWERFAVEKKVGEASVAERMAAAEKMKSDILVNNIQAKIYGLEKDQLEGRLMYGNFLMTYLPQGVRNKLMNNVVKFFEDNPNILNDVIKDAKNGVNPGKKAFSGLYDWATSKDLIQVKTLSKEEFLKSIGFGG